MTKEPSVIEPSDELSSSVLEDGDYNLSALNGESEVSSITADDQPCMTSTDASAKRQIVSILRNSTRFRYQGKHQHQRRSSNQSGHDDKGQDELEDNGQPSHWPTDRPSVRFIDGATNQSLYKSPVTSFIHRPYTEPSELSNLYYTSIDFDQFKREYRALVKAQRRKRIGKSDVPNNDETSMKKSSFWRSKFYGRFYDPSHSPFSQPEEEEKEYRGSSSSAGLFSSVFDVAKEAASIFNGSGNYSYYQNQTSPQSKARQQQQLLVDTLYSNLF